MSAPRVPTSVHPVIRRTIIALSVTYALAWAGAAMVVGPGSAALVAITGDVAHAGFFVALFSVSSAAGALFWGRLMDQAGRRRVLAVAHLSGAVGYGLAGVGVSMGMLPVFVAGGALLAFAFGGVLLTRVAAAEIFPPSERGRGVGWVQISATVGAVVGPTFLILSDPIGHFLGRDPLGLVWFFAPPLHLFAAFFVLRATEPMMIARDVERYHPHAAPAPPLVSGQAPGLLILIAVLTLASFQAAMVAVMGVAGAAVHQAGHAVWVLGVVMVLHFFGMFGFSRVAGKAADRIGRRSSILLGAGIVAIGGGVIAVVPGVPGLGAGLLLVGVGWSFGFIAATVLLTDLVAPLRRARVVGRADLTAQLSAAVLSLAGGWWFARHGVEGLGLLAVVIVVVPVLLVLVLMRTRPPRAPQAAPAGP